MSKICLHILVVDDSKAVLAHVREVLESEGHTVSTAGGPRDGLKYLTSADVDLLLLDVEMPSMTGYQLCSYIRKHPEWQTLPIIFLSGRHDEESIIQGFTAGGNDYITKPFNARELIARIEAHGFKAMIERDLAVKTRALEELTARQEAIIEERTKELQRSHQLAMETLATLAKERTTQEHILNTRKLESLGNLVAEVAHQVNTPLGNSVTTSTYLQNRLKDVTVNHAMASLSKGQFEDFLKDTDAGLKLLDSSLAKVGTTIERFKLIAVNQYTDTPTDFRLGPTLDLIVQHFRHRAEPRGITVELGECPEANLRGFPGIISIIVENTFNNALDHAFPAGQSGTISLNADLGETKLCLHYADNGIGMDPDSLAHLWEPFYSTKRQDGFLGLGMFVVHNLVCGKLGGTLSCNSSPGKGTRITFCMEVEQGAPNV